VTGVDATTQRVIMDILQEQGRRGRTVVATTHDLACAARRFHCVAGINRTVVAQGPASLILKPEILAAIYGGHLLVVGGRTYLLDDAHHHDQAAADEKHFHPERETTHVRPPRGREGGD
jgi:ABC-type Mn2+/Zn2+ transport system ATPase subunit